jgi:hypothetical protein
VTNPYTFMRFELGPNAIAEITISHKLDRAQLRQLRAFLDVWWRDRLGAEELPESEVPSEEEVMRVLRGAP